MKERKKGMRIKNLREVLSLFFMGFSWSLMAADYPVDLEVNNFYGIRNIKHNLPLTHEALTPGNANLNNEHELTKEKETELRQEELDKGFRFVKRENGFLIQNIRNKSLCLEGEGISYKFYNEREANKFVWNIEDIKHPENPFIFRIQHQQSGKFLYIQEKVKEQDGIKFSSYTSCAGAREEGNPAFEWRLYPFYPESGYSDFFMIVRDYALVLGLRHNMKLMHIKHIKDSPHDQCGLSIACLGKTHINLNPGVGGFKSYRREIFASEDALVCKNESTLRVTRSVELEEVFETTIEKSFTMGDRTNQMTGTNTADREAKAEQHDYEQTSQRIYKEALMANVCVGISSTSETASEQATGVASRTSSSQTHNTHSKQESSSNLNGGLSTPFVSIGGSSSSSSQEGKSDTVHSEKGTSEQKSSSQRVAQGRTDQQTNQQGKEQGSEDLSGKSNSQSQQDTQEHIKGSTNEFSVSLEKTINVGEIKSSTTRKNERWVVEREILQTPGSVLEVKFFEEAVEVSNYVFEVDLKLSGYIGFKFNKFNPDVFKDINPYKDYSEKDMMWCISPTTILRTLPAPGYQVHPDGSVIYKAKGSMNLKHPMNILTVITEQKIQDD